MRSEKESAGVDGMAPNDPASPTIRSAASRRARMLEFSDTVLAFYPREIAKITQRIGEFEEMKQFWLARPESEAGSQR
jgi:hypothetical protein